MNNAQYKDIDFLNLIISFSFKTVSWLRSFLFGVCAMLGDSCKQGNGHVEELMLLDPTRNCGSVAGHGPP